MDWMIFGETFTEAPLECPLCIARFMHSVTEEHKGSELYKLLKFVVKKEGLAQMAQKACTESVVR